MEMEGGFKLKQFHKFEFETFVRDFYLFLSFGSFLDICL